VSDILDSFSDLEHALPVPRGTAVVLSSRMLAEPSRSVAPVAPTDPARLGYPPTFPIELALRTSSVRAICEAYGIDREEWDRVRFEPVFMADLERAVKLVAEEGMSFKLKAKLQAEELLKTSWRLIHDPSTPPQTRADLLKATMRWAEYDSPPGKDSVLMGGRSGFQVNINFRNAIVQTT
jgi:hypothetical protein